MTNQTDNPASRETARQMTRRSATVALAWLGTARMRAAARPLRVATFRADVTPEPGEPLIWTTPAAKTEDPLWAKGVVLEDAGIRYVLCAVDWCGLSNSTHLLFRTRIARAAGTSVDRVLVHAVHQHTAPYVDGDAYGLLSKLPRPPRTLSDGFVARVTDRLARAAGEAAGKLQPFDAVGTGEAPVERVASARRILAADGHVIVRYSTSGKDAAMAALPEGSIDPMLRTVTLAAAGKPLVRLHYYATHPQTFCCDGRVSGDIVSDAREAVEKSEGVFQVYFTGCAGDVTVGKYNDGTLQAQRGLAARLEQAMRASIRSVRLAPAEKIKWQTAALDFPGNAKGGEDLGRLAARESATPDELYRAAIRLAFARRKRPFEAALLEIGGARILHLPGEPMLEFQNYARSVRPGADAGRVGWFHLPLDVDRMQSAARELIGEHDFSAFRSSECQARSPVRQLHALEVRRSGDYIIMDFCANAFLHHMVRNIVGALVYVGKGAREQGWLAELLSGRDRTRSAPTFDAAGLYLSGVEYDRAFGLPAAGGAAWAVSHAAGAR